MPELDEQDQVASAVSDLTQAVTDMRDGLVDEATVRRIAEEVVAGSSNLQRSGYQPPDVDPEIERRGLSTDPVQRLRQIHATPVREGARLSGRDSHDVAHFHEASDRLLILAAAMQVSDPRQLGYYEDTYVPAVRALDTQTAGEGAEFIPTGLSSSLIERVNLQLRVLDLFPVIPMPTNPFEIPGRAVNRLRGGRFTEQTADTGQAKIKVITPGTRKVTLRAAMFAARVLVSKEEEEDSIIAVLPFLEEEIVDYIAGDLEDAAQNGDTAVTHRDFDVTAADDPRKNWNGIRKAAADAGASRDGGADKATVADARANRGLMGRYGVNPAELAHIASIKSYIDLLSDETVQTVDKYGPNATVVTGELARVDGVPILVSEFARENLAATGVNTNAGPNTKSILQTVYRKGFVRGKRRDLTVQVLRELYAESDQDGIVVTTRQALSNRYPGEPVAAVTINLAPGV